MSQSLDQIQKDNKDHFDVIERVADKAKEAQQAVDDYKAKNTNQGDKT
jgi:hypothetical protein